MAKLSWLIGFLVYVTAQFAQAKRTKNTTYPSHFNLTAISAAHGKSILECWQLTDPIITTSQDGIVGSAMFQLGNLANGSYSVVPANFAGTSHPAPMNQYAVFLSGTLNITIIDPPQQYFLHGGPNGILFAIDTADKSRQGHISSSLNEPLVGLQIPTPDGQIPGHTVLHKGGCNHWELNF